MSVVSGITLQHGLIEEYALDSNENYERFDLVEKINHWLDGRGHGPLVSVEDIYGGGKNPQIKVYGGGFNHFPEEEFAAFVMSLAWEDLENVVLLIHPEDGPTKVFRPVQG